MNPEQMNESLEKRLMLPAEQIDDGIEAELELAKKSEAADLPMRSLADYKRDLEKKNVLIDGRWLVRGGIAMMVSTTGTGKSILQTQMALSFNRGIDCCGLHPMRPLQIWIIQSEDDEDRVAIDRDEIREYLQYQHPVDDKGNPIDWDEAGVQIKLLEITGKTGARFLDELDRYLRAFPLPDIVFINPLNAYFGGILKEGADVSAFLKGGRFRGDEIEGLESILKRYNVAAIIFSHTGKPPAKDSERKAWLTDTFSVYKMCGASEIADAVRSVITFLPCPKHKGFFIFTAGKNGSQLGWKDAAGNSTLRALYQWGECGKHYWQDVPKEAWGQIFKDAGIKDECTAPKVEPPEPEPDKDEIALRVFEEYKTLVPKCSAADDVRNAVNQELTKYATKYRLGDRVKLLGQKAARELIESLYRRGKIEILSKGETGTRGAACGLPEMVEAFKNSKLLDVESNPIDDSKPAPSFDNYEPPAFGRSKKFNDAVNKAAREEEQCAQLEDETRGQV